jgi:hypothetical protein
MLRVQEFLKAVCAVVMRSTFERHRLAAALHVVRSARAGAAAASVATEREWSALLAATAPAGGSATADSPLATTAAPAWVPGALRARFDALVAQVPEVAQAARFADGAAWAAWAAEATPDGLPAVAGGLSRFQKALVLQARSSTWLHHPGSGL